MLCVRSEGRLRGLKRGPASVPHEFPEASDMRYRRSMRWRQSAASLGLGLSLFLACGGGNAEDTGASAGATTKPGEADGMSGMSEGETETGGEEGGPSPGPFAEACEDAPVLEPGRVRGNLRGRSEQFGGACGLGGPELFFAVELPQRADVIIDVVGADFAPRLEWTNADCLVEPTFACSFASTFVAYDVAAGSKLRFSVGIDPDAPALAVPFDPTRPDPLDFDLSLGLRAVLQAGQPCADPQGQASELGRCGGALVCGDDGLCGELPSNACANALPIVLAEPGQSSSLSVDAEEGFTDVHAHSCAGQRLAERVFAIDRGQLESFAGQELEISQTAPVGPDPGVAMAIRAPGCLAEHEIACAADLLNGPVRVPVDDLLTPGVGAAYLFADIPDGADGVISLSVAVVDP